MMQLGLVVYLVAQAASSSSPAQPNPDYVAIRRRMDEGIRYFSRAQDGTVGAPYRIVATQGSENPCIFNVDIQWPNGTLSRDLVDWRARRTVVSAEGSAVVFSPPQGHGNTIVWDLGSDASAAQIASAAQRIIQQCADRTISTVPRDGTFGTWPGQMTFAFLAENSAAVRIQEYSRHRIFQREADGTYALRSSDGSIAAFIRIIDQDAVDIVEGGNTSRFVRTADYQAWVDYSTAQNRAATAYYESEIARLQAEQAAQAAAYREPEPQAPMGPSLLEGIQELSRQAQVDVDRTRRELDQTIAAVEAQNAARAQQDSARLADARIRAANEASARQAVEVTRQNVEVQRQLTIAQANLAQQPLRGTSSGLVGWCWAAAGNGFRVNYVSRMERTTLHTEGDRIVGGDNNASWITTRSREFEGMIPAHETERASCGVRPDASGFDYVKSTLYSTSGGYRVVEVNWAPR